MEGIFQIVYLLLKAISDITGLSYNEVNIVAYYIILPFIYVALADKIIKKNIIKVIYVVGIVIALFLIKDFSTFSDWLFMESVDFLKSFRFLGWNYVVSSVMICVIFPGIVFLIMFHLAFPKFFKAFFNRFLIDDDGDERQ